MSVLACLEAITEISDQMLVAAQAYQWETLRQLEVKERSLIDRLHAEKHPENVSIESAKAFIQKTLNNHTLIFSIAEPLHQDMKALLESFLEPAGTIK